MKTYKKIYNDEREVIAYVCNEDQRLIIEVERGSNWHNRPTGYILKYEGRADCINEYLTLSEAKEWADYYFPNI